MFNFIKKGSKEILKKTSKGAAQESGNFTSDNMNDALDSLNKDMMERNKKLAEQIARNQLG